MIATDSFVDSGGGGGGYTVTTDDDDETSSDSSTDSSTTSTTTSTTSSNNDGGDTFDPDENTLGTGFGEFTDGDDEDVTVEEPDSDPGDSSPAGGAGMEEATERFSGAPDEALDDATRDELLEVGNESSDYYEADTEEEQQQAQEEVTETVQDIASGDSSNESSNQASNEPSNQPSNEPAADESGGPNFDIPSIGSFDGVDDIPTEMVIVVVALLALVVYGGN